MVKRALLSGLLLLAGLSFARAENFSIPAGTTIHCRLTQALSTKLNFQGDPFRATVTEPYVVNGREIIPVGSTIEGRIAELTRPGRIRGVGEMQLTVSQIIFPDGRLFPLNAALLSTYGAEGVKVTGEEGIVKGPSSRIRDVEEIGLGIGGGGVLGTIIGGVHGAFIGGVIGGAAGLADTFRRRGKELTLPTGTELNYQLTHDLVVDNQAPRASVSQENLSVSR